MLPLLGDGHLERNWSSDRLCGEGGQAAVGYPSVWIPLSLSLLFRQGKLPDCSQLCKPWSLEGISPTLSGCVFGGWELEVFYKV